VDFPDWKKVPLPWQPTPGIFQSAEVGRYFGTKTGYAACHGSGWVRLIPQEILFIVAEEHCLIPAYENRCPGVDPEALFQWRIKNLAAIQKRDAADVLRAIEESANAINAAPRIMLSNVELVDLRGIHVAELPEAQVYLGVSVLCDGFPSREKRRKVNCMGTEAACRSFLGSLDSLGCDPRSGYGEPRLGVVGAYRAKTRGK
jgi:hypothetical protein